jgi:hypothetical protein
MGPAAPGAWRIATARRRSSTTHRDSGRGRHAGNCPRDVEPRQSSLTEYRASAFTVTATLTTMTAPRRRDPRRRARNKYRNMVGTFSGRLPGHRSQVAGIPRLVVGTAAARGTVSSWTISDKEMPP